MRSQQQSCIHSMDLENTKRQLIRESRLLLFLERLGTRGSEMRRRPGLNALAGRIINMACARGFDIYTIFRLAVRRFTMHVNLEEILARETLGAASESEKMGRLCSYVFENIAYARSVAWLKPSDVVRLGYGDCKCQARLLQDLLTMSGQHAHVVVGITGHRTRSGSVHAWVETQSDGEVVICDPTLCPHPLSPEEYAVRMGGVLDVTEEYSMKRFNRPFSRQERDQF